MLFRVVIIMSYTSNYINWLKSNIVEEKISRDCVELTMPFLDRHNDHIQLYIKTIDSKYLITDQGYTITDLALSGVTFETSKRKELFNFNLSRHGVKHSDQDDSLYVISDIKDLAMAQHSLMQAILDIDDMFYLSSSNVKSIFIDEVASFFDAHNIYYSENIQMQGKSGFSFNYEFLLQRNKSNNERLIKIMNTPSKINAQRFIFQWEDTSAERNLNSTKATDFFVVINDDNGSIDSISSAFENYNIVSIPWSERSKYIDKFA